MRAVEQEQARYNWLRPSQVAERLDCSTEHALALLRSGAFGAGVKDISLRPGEGRPEYRIAPEAVDEFLAARTVTPEAA